MRDAVELLESEFERLIQECCFKIVTREGHGTGFFIAPGHALTCAHVIFSESDKEPHDFYKGEWTQELRCTVVWQSQEADLALLKLSDSSGEIFKQHPCVRLGDDVSVGDPCYSFGFPDNRPSGDPATTSVEGTLPGYLKLKEGQIRPGMSGSPLLNQRTRRVCGIVSMTRDRSSDLGARGIHIRVFRSAHKDIDQLQSEFHQTDDRWQRLSSSAQSEHLLPPRITSVPIRAISLAIRATVYVIAIGLAVLVTAPKPFRTFVSRWNINVAGNSSLYLFPIILLVGLDAIPSFIIRRRARLLEVLGASHSLAQKRFFRTTPYENTPADVERFKRPDGADREIVDWVAQSPHKLMILSGRSGAGKSSLVNASLIPQLLKPTYNYFAITLRGFGDPLAELRRAIIRSKELWKERPPALDTIDLLCQILEEMQPRRMLIIFDQFEEFLIIHHRNPLAFGGLKNLLKRIEESRLGNIQFLLVLRSDYLGAIESFEIPKLSQDRNWKEIRPFIEREALNFLESSGLPIAPDDLGRVVQDLSDIEETSGLIRPITLNMAGMVLERQPLRTKRLGSRALNVRNMLVQYIRDCVTKSTSSESSVPMLRAMITASGSKHPRSVNYLAEITGFPKNRIKGALLELYTNGLVRRVDEENDVWEVSHDFVARLILSAVSAWRGLWIRRSIQILAVFGVILTIGFEVVKPQLDYKHALEMVNNGGGNVTTGEDGRSVYFAFSNLEVSEALPFIAHLNPVQEIDLNNTKITDEKLAKLSKVEGLHTLKINDNGLTNKGLVSISKLVELKDLTLDGNTRITSVESLAALSHLETLSLDKTSLDDNALAALANLPLRELSLNDVKNVGVNLKWVRDLKNLQTLQLSRTRVTDETVRDFIVSIKTLRSLYLTGTGITNTTVRLLSQAETLEELIIEDNAIGDGLFSDYHSAVKLRELWLKNTHINDRDLKDISNIPNLEILSIPNTSVTDAGMADIAKLTKLTKLYIGGNKISDLSAPLLAKLENLETLYIPGTQISDSGLTLISSLPKLINLRIDGSRITEEGKAKVLAEKPGLIFKD